MKVEQLMTRTIETCRSDDRLNRAAQIRWEHDCGVVPILAAGNGAGHVVGMVTDRDICMAAYTQGRPLAAIPVASAMSHQVYSCRPTDSLAVALKVMETNQVHRLPVLDQNDELIGMLSLADVAREARHEHDTPRPQVTDTALAEAVEAISASRTSGTLVAAA